MGHVVNVVGGSSSQEKYGSQPGPRFTPFPRQRQREALQFLNENAFRTPQFFLDPAVLRRMEPEGALARIRTAQTAVLTALLNNSRLTRLIEYNALATNGSDTYSLREMTRDLRDGIWSELGSSRVQIDAFRRNLQHAYLELVGTKINGPFPTAPAGATPQQAAAFVSPPDEARGLMRSELMALDARLRDAIPRAGDPDTRIHLVNARHRIDVILNPNK
jgi:hypothetical protein